ncbi:hypothetical protein K438DRAFT_1938905 [Mycena galopus ATCC 62051]|nr:hypothetical protein K438DRAFT_1938905 [Mycena galopus ATCC 62051]
MYLPSPSLSVSAGTDGSGNAPCALPVPPDMSVNSTAARNAAPAGHLPKRWTPAQLGAPQHHGHSRGGFPRAMSAGARLCAWAMGEEELRRMGARPALRPAARALSQEVLAPSSSLSLVLVFFRFRRRGCPRQPLALPPRRLHPRCVAPACRAVYEEPGEMEDADGDADLDAQHAHKNDGTPSHRRRLVASPFATSSSRASFSSNATSSPFAPKHKQSPFASRYEYEYLTTTNANANNADDGWGRASASPSPSPTGRFRNGRVKGMVHSFESSGAPERGSGGGFRGEGGGGSRFLQRKANQNEDEEDGAIGGTWCPHAHGYVQAHGTRSSGNGNGRALPVRPDGASGYGYAKAHVDVLNPGATDRATVPCDTDQHWEWAAIDPSAISLHLLIDEASLPNPKPDAPTNF